MSTTDNLLLPLWVESQAQPHIPINESLVRLDGSLTASLTVDASAGGTITITATQMRNHGRFVLDGSPADDFTFELPAVRRFVVIRNISGRTATVRATGSPGQTVTLPDGAQVLAYATGSAGANLWVVAQHGGPLVGATLRDVREAVNALGNVDGATEVSLAAGNVATMTLVGDVTLSFTGVPAGVAVTLTLIIVQDGTGGNTVTWPGSVVWPGGIPPALPLAANADAMIVLVTVNGGSSWRGALAGAEFA
jgi:hypothetical protein